MPEPRGQVVVTGAAGAIGRAIAERLAVCGYDLLLVDRHAPEEAAAAAARHGVSARSVLCDLSDGQAVQGCVEAIAAAGVVHGLVNAAAHQFVSQMDEVSDSSWQAVLAVNVTAPFLLARHMVPGMRRRGRGRIVNIISNTIWQPPGPGMVPYVTSKAALLGMTRSMAVELAGTGVTVNAVAPGLTDTPAARAAMPPEAFDAVVSRQAVRRPLRPEDQGGAVAFLLSEDADAISGQAIRVDGGLITL